MEMNHTVSTHFMWKVFGRSINNNDYGWEIEVFEVTNSILESGQLPIMLLCRENLIYTDFVVKSVIGI